MIIPFTVGVIALLILIFVWRVARDSRRRYEVVKRGVEIFKQGSTRP